MKYTTLLFCLTISSLVFVHPAAAEDTLDTLLPPPGWLRRNAEALGIDASTREELELVYEEKEPKYHQLKYKVERLTSQLYPILGAGDLDEDAIKGQMTKLLQAENALKLYQVHVRISLLSELTRDERRAVQKHAKKNPPAYTSWRGGLTAKVDRIRELSHRAESNSALLKQTETQMKYIDKAFANGKVGKGNRMLDEVIRELESSLK